MWCTWRVASAGGGTAATQQRNLEVSGSKGVNDRAWSCQFQMQFFEVHCSLYCGLTIRLIYITRNSSPPLVHSSSVQASSAMLLPGGLLCYDHRSQAIAIFRYLTRVGSFPPLRLLKSAAYSL